MVSYLLILDLLLLSISTCLHLHRAHADPHDMSAYTAGYTCSSVSDQLQSNVGRSHNTAVGGDKEMCRVEEEGRKGDRQRQCSHPAGFIVM